MRRAKTEIYRLTQPNGWGTSKGKQCPAYLFTTAQYYTDSNLGHSSFVSIPNVQRKNINIARSLALFQINPDKCARPSCLFRLFAPLFPASFSSHYHGTHTSLRSSLPHWHETRTVRHSSCVFHMTFHCPSSFNAHLTRHSLPGRSVLI